MNSFDTNVVVRLLVRDDAEQCERAERAWRAAIAGRGVYLSLVTLIETAWVLRVAYKLDRGEIARQLRRVLDSVGVTIEGETLARRAIDCFEVGSADLSDYLILETSRAAAALPVLTFDERFARERDVLLVP